MEVVAYAVLCRDLRGIKHVKLVSSWWDVDEIEAPGLAICDDDVLNDEDVKPLLRRLAASARDELSCHVAAESI